MATYNVLNQKTLFVKIEQQKNIQDLRAAPGIKPGRPRCKHLTSKSVIHCTYKSWNVSLVLPEVKSSRGSLYQI